jgi:hypothetical protein
MPPVNRNTRPVRITYETTGKPRRAASHTYLERALVDALGLLDREPGVTAFTAAGAGTPMFTVTPDDRNGRTVRVEQLGDSARAAAGAAFARGLLADGIGVYVFPDGAPGPQRVTWRLASVLCDQPASGVVSPDDAKLPAPSCTPKV